MTFITDMKIARKVAALLIMLGIVTLGLSSLSYRTINSIDSDYSALAGKTLPATTELARANRRAVEMMYAGYRAMAYEGGSAEGRVSARELEESYAAGKQSFEKALETDPSLAEQMPELLRSFEDLHATVARAAQLGLANRKEEAMAVLREADKQLAESQSKSAGLNSARIEAGDRKILEVSASASSTSFWMLAISAIAVVGGVALAMLVSRAAIVAPLDRLRETMRHLAAGNNKVAVEGVERGDEVGAMAKAVLVFRDAAVAQELAAVEKAKSDADQKFVVDTVSEKLASVSEGDLTAEIKAEFPPSYVQLRTNFNSALTNLRDLIGSVIESSHSLRTGSSEIAHASEDLARRTESNAASLEETSAALTQIDGRIKATAQAAGRTVTRADEAITTVSGGRAVADEAVQAMSRVRESAKGIDEVIEGVDKIAFQTRVLAMNAAVEAGRAGDAGRGFAVVADLVSALAMRAEEEAKRARDQLTVTQTDIVTAVEAVQRVDGALAGISEGVGEVHQLLGGMASDNQAQASAISQISVAVNNMDQATQQNAAMVEETSAAARNLNSESEALAGKASQFRISDGGKSAKIMAKPSATFTAPVVNDQASRLSIKAKANGSAPGIVATASTDEDWASF
ncbi:methyl-accepting chemotaxis protein [Novosphingobium sp. RD2P27]|uniref:Methyl-accepting chemotaxis protein n=1 Tax=Novosphingobium kalidii TaxID=3230299 RepID=A0ABV2CZM3_9SPHN